MIPWELMLKRPGSYLSQNFFGAVGPGFILLVEILLLWAPLEAVKTPHDAFAYLTRGTVDLGFVGAVVLVVVIGFGSFIAGRGCRALLLRISTRWGSIYTVSRSDIWEWLIRGYGEEAVSSVLRRHPIWHLVRPPYNTEVGSGEARNFGLDHHFPLDNEQVALREHIFLYCKGWLRLNEPRLSVDYIEAEIYAFLSLVIPLLLGDMLALRWAIAAQDRLFALSIWIVATILIGLASRSIWRAANWRRRHEPGTALYNFLLAHWALTSRQSEFNEPQTSSLS
jgi:hypothetical protein